MTKIIGIDLGTSNSAAAVLEGGRPVLIPSAEGTSLYGKSFPSYVAFTKDGHHALEFAHHVSLKLLKGALHIL